MLCPVESRPPGLEEMLYKFVVDSTKEQEMRAGGNGLGS